MGQSEGVEFVFRCLSVIPVLCCGSTYTNSEDLSILTPCVTTQMTHPGCFLMSTVHNPNKNLGHCWSARSSPHRFLFQGHSATSSPACWAPPLTPTSIGTAPLTRSPSSPSTSLKPTMKRSVPLLLLLRRPSLPQKSKTARIMSQTKLHR